MKNLTVEKLMSELNISKSFANVIRYTSFVETGIIYTNQGYNAPSAIKYLEKNCNVTFKSGNDAPKGGKWGNFVQVIETQEYKDFIIRVLELNHLANVQAEAIEVKRKEKISSFEITPEMIEIYKKKTDHLDSNEQKRDVASEIIKNHFSELIDKLMNS